MDNIKLLSGESQRALLLEAVHRSKYNDSLVHLQVVTTELDRAHKQYDDAAKKLDISKEKLASELVRSAKSDAKLDELRANIFKLCQTELYLFKIDNISKKSVDNQCSKLANCLILDVDIKADVEAFRLVKILDKKNCVDALNYLDAMKEQYGVAQELCKSKRKSWYDSKEKLYRAQLNLTNAIA